jgi:hypothetical protein
LSSQAVGLTFLSHGSGSTQAQAFPAAPAPSGSEPRDESTFSEIIAQHTRLLDEDNEDNEPVVSENWTNIPISRLFNFTNDSWSSRYGRFAALTFEEELELYDLLEMDAEGDDDPEVRFDETTQDILLG